MGTGKTPRDSNFTSFTFTDTSGGTAPVGTLENLTLWVHTSGDDANGGKGTPQPLTNDDYEWSWIGVQPAVDCVYVQIEVITPGGKSKTTAPINIGWTNAEILGMTTCAVTFDATGKLNTTITAVTDAISVP